VAEADLSTMVPMGATAVGMTAMVVVTSKEDMAEEVDAVEDTMEEVVDMVVVVDAAAGMAMEEEEEVVVTTTTIPLATHTPLLRQPGNHPRLVAQDLAWDYRPLHLQERMAVGMVVDTTMVTVKRRLRRNITVVVVVVEVMGTTSTEDSPKGALVVTSRIADTTTTGRHMETTVAAEVEVVVAIADREDMGGRKIKMEQDVDEDARKVWSWFGSVCVSASVKCHMIEPETAVWPHLVAA